MYFKKTYFDAVHDIFLHIYHRATSSFNSYVDQARIIHLPLRHHNPYQLSIYKSTHTTSFTSHSLLTPLTDLDITSTHGRNPAPQHQ